MLALPLNVTEKRLGGKSVSQKKKQNNVAIDVATQKMRGKVCGNTLA